MASREEIIAQKEKTGLALIRAALELCAEEGFASLSLRSVARKAGIAPTSFYRHFRDIDELGVSMAIEAKKILDECLGDIRKRIQLSYTKKPGSAMDLIQAVDAFISPFAKTFMEYFKSRSHLLSLFFQERTGSSPVLRGAISMEIDKLVDFISEDLARLTDSIGKGVGDTRLIAEAMLTIIMASGMDKMVDLESSDEIISKSMSHKLNLLLIGAITREESPPL